MKLLETSLTLAVGGGECLGSCVWCVGIAEVKNSRKRGKETSYHFQHLHSEMTIHLHLTISNQKLSPGAVYCNVIL